MFIKIYPHAPPLYINAHNLTVPGIVALDETSLRHREQLSDRFKVNGKLVVKCIGIDPLSGCPKFSHRAIFMPGSLVTKPAAPGLYDNKPKEHSKVDY